MEGAETSLCRCCRALSLSVKDFITPCIATAGYLRPSRPLLEDTPGNLMQRQSCPLCRLILFNLSQHERGALPVRETVWDLRWFVQNPEYDWQNGQGSALYASFRGSPPRKHMLYRMELFELFEHRDTVRLLRPRAVNETGIDIDQVKAWIHRCQSLHSKACEENIFFKGYTDKQRYSFWIVDVRNQCLTRIGRRQTYLTLSYVWGTTNNVATGKADLGWFRLPGAFRRLDLPRTIRDAMDLTRDLGFLYLWVDSLCIV